MTPRPRPVLVLVGPPGAGKTTVGRVLARRLGVPFADADALIVQRAGKPVSDIFLDDGEPAFRELEAAVVAGALSEQPGVLALGGGAVLAEATRELLRGHRVVHLTVGLADGLRRTGMSTARPLLAGVNPRATFRALLEARAPLYREVATVEVDTVRRRPGQVAVAVLEALGEPVDGPLEDLEDGFDPDPGPGGVGHAPAGRTDDPVVLPTPTLLPDPSLRP